MSGNSIDVHALAGAFALDALSDLERAAFTRHMAGCPACELEVAELRETASRLAEPVAATPPRRLRDAVLAEVARTRQERPAAQVRTPGRVAAVRWRRWIAAAVAAGVIAAGAGTATWIVVDQRHRAEQARLAAVTELLQAPDSRLLRRPVPGGGQATLVISRERNSGVVVLTGLPRQDEARAYQLWLFADVASARSQGLLGPGQTGTTMRIGPLDDATTFGLSLEPANGSPRPTNVIQTVQLT